MSIALLVMFIAYALQVKHSPYMSPADYEEVLEDHQEKAQAGSALHTQLALALQKAKYVNEVRIACSTVG